MKNTAPPPPVSKDLRTPKLYRIAHVMELLEISNATIYRMIARGELDVVRLSLRSSRITSESVARILDGRNKKA
jgi:excisionase family DNA binding protein